MIDARTKTMAFVLPFLAIFLAFLLKEEAWIDRSAKRTWREVMHPETMPGADAIVPSDAAAAGAPEGKAPADGDPAGDTAATDTPPVAPGDRPEPEAKPKPEPAPVPSAKEIDYTIKQPPQHRGALPLTVPASERLDITVSPGGAPMMKGKFLDPGTAAMMMAADDRKATGLAMVIATERTPWKAVGEILNAARGAGWTRVALAVQTADRPGKARLLPVDFPPPGDPVEEDIPVTRVTVTTVSGQPRFELMGTTYSTLEELAAEAKALHDDEFEVFVKGYSNDVATTPWIIDGTEGTARGVVQAWDALNLAGVVKVRLEGVHLPE